MVATPVRHWIEEIIGLHQIGMDDWAIPENRAWLLPLARVVEFLFYVAYWFLFGVVFYWIKQLLSRRRGRAREAPLT